jgi:hypothetical protein
LAVSENPFIQNGQQFQQTGFDGSVSFREAGTNPLFLTAMFRAPL